LEPVFLNILLLGDVRQKCHESRAFDGGSYEPLVLGASASPFRGHDLGSLVDESLECLWIFVIHISLTLDAEKALFFLYGGSISLGIVKHNTL